MRTQKLFVLCLACLLDRARSGGGSMLGARQWATSARSTRALQWVRAVCRGRVSAPRPRCAFKTRARAPSSRPHSRQITPNARPRTCLRVCTRAPTIVARAHAPQKNSPRARAPSLSRCCCHGATVLLRDACTRRAIPAAADLRAMAASLDRVLDGASAWRALRIPCSLLPNLRVLPLSPRVVRCCCSFSSTHTTTTHAPRRRAASL